MNVREDIQALLNDPERLLQKKPFTRGADRTFFPRIKKTTEVGETIQVNLPKYRRYNLPQEQYLRELDCACHDVLFDENPWAKLSIIQVFVTFLRFFLFFVI